MKIWQGTVAQQLMIVLIIVLLIAQMINLTLLVGERRLVVQASNYDNALQQTIQSISALPNIDEVELPYTLPNNINLPAVFFLSISNHAAAGFNSTRLPELEKQLAQILSEQSIEALSTQIVIREIRLADRPPPNGSPRPSDLNQTPPNRQSPGLSRRPPPDGNYNGQQGRPPLNRQGANRFDPQLPVEPIDLSRGMQELVISVQVRSGIWFNALIQHYPVTGLNTRILLATVIMLVITILTVGFFIRKILKPWSKFADAANRLGRSDSLLLLDESGPEDVRKAAIAFNNMQKRLSGAMEGQRNMFRAVGHDLRTPLTALRIRAEDLPLENSLRDKFISSIDDMTVMTEDLLSWAKDISPTEEIADVNLNAFLASITDDFEDQGADIELDDCKEIIVRIRRVAIKRALENLITNALKYGKCAHISIEVIKDYINIHIDDKGPGIPESQIDDVLKPFVRVETSRNKSTGGVGLGLSIADTIVQANGGKLTLQNLHGQGLRATLKIPN